MALILLLVLTGCAEKEPERNPETDPFVGTFGGTASYQTEVELVIDQDNTIVYTDEMETHTGTWTRRDDNSIEADFDGKAFGRWEPMIVTMSDGKNTITVDFSEPGLGPSVYQRQSS